MGAGHAAGVADRDGRDRDLSGRAAPVAGAGRAVRRQRTRHVRADATLACGRHGGLSQLGPDGGAHHRTRQSGAQVAAITRERGMRGVGRDVCAARLARQRPDGGPVSWGGVPDRWQRRRAKLLRTERQGTGLPR